MGAQMSLVIAAGFACFVCASIGIDVAITAASRGRRAANASARVGQGWIAWRVRNGVRPLVPCARALLAIRWVDVLAVRLVNLVRERGLTASKESVLTIVMVGAVIIALVVGIVAQSAVVALIAAGACVAACSMAAAAQEERRRSTAYESLPDALSCMSACFNAGFTLLQTFRQVAQDVKGPLAEPFNQAAHSLEIGGNASDALDQIKRGCYSRELAFVAVALDVQHQSGGSMKQVLEAVVDSVRGELALKRSLRVQTAQAKLSARIVSAMPVVLIVLFSVVSPGFLDPFFQSALGAVLLGVAVVMQVAGILLVRRALAVGGAV